MKTHAAPRGIARTISLLLLAKILSILLLRPSIYDVVRTDLDLRP